MSHAFTSSSEGAMSKPGDRAGWLNKLARTDFFSVPKLLVFTSLLPSTEFREVALFLEVFFAMITNTTNATTKKTRATIYTGEKDKSILLSNQFLKAVEYFLKLDGDFL